MEDIKKIPQRSEIAVEDTWAIEDLYASDDAWAEDLKILEAEGDAMAAYAGRLGESGAVLAEYLTKMDGEQIKNKEQCDTAEKHEHKCNCNGSCGGNCKCHPKKEK